MPDWFNVWAVITVLVVLPALALAYVGLFTDRMRLATGALVTMAIAVLGFVIPAVALSPFIA